MFFDPFGDFGEVFVLLADVVFFAKVHEVDDGFCGEEEEGVDHFDLDQIPVSELRYVMTVRECFV